MTAKKFACHVFVMLRITLTYFTNPLCITFHPLPPHPPTDWRPIAFGPGWMWVYFGLASVRFRFALVKGYGSVQFGLLCFASISSTNKPPHEILPQFSHNSTRGLGLPIDRSKVWMAKGRWAIFTLISPQVFHSAYQDRVIWPHGDAWSRWAYASFNGFVKWTCSRELLMEKPASFFFVCLAREEEEGTHQLSIQLYHLPTKYLQLVPLNLSCDPWARFCRSLMTNTPKPLLIPSHYTAKKRWWEMKN